MDQIVIEIGEWWIHIFCRTWHHALFERDQEQMLS